MLFKVRARCKLGKIKAGDILEVYGVAFCNGNAVFIVYSESDGYFLWYPIEQFTKI